jgi:hypothetical protein
MRLRGVLPVIGLLLAASTVTWAMDLRDMPPWMRDMIRPVYIDWQQVAEQASLDPAGVHIWGPLETFPAPAGVRVAAPGVAPVTAPVASASPVVGATVAGQVTLAPPSGTGTAAAAAVRAPAGPVSVGEQGVHLGDVGADLVEGTAASARSVRAARWLDFRVPDAVDPRAASLLHWSQALLGDGSIGPEDFPEWADEHHITLDSLVGALEAMPIRKRMALDYLPVCASVWLRHGQDVRACHTLPPKSRLLVASYLEVEGKTEEALELCSSTSDEELSRLSDREVLAGIGETLFFANMAQRVAIWAWKRAADLRGPDTQAWYAAQLQTMCQRIDDPEVTRRELLPWVETALASPTSPAHWRHGVVAIVWATGHCEGFGRARAAAQRYLAVTQDRGIDDPLLAPSVWLVLARLARDAGEVGDAAALYRDVLTSGAPEPRLAEVAELELVDMGEAVADAGHVRPRFAATAPRRVLLSHSSIEASAATIVVFGNYLLRVTGLACDAEDVHARIGAVSMHGSEAEQRVHVQATSGWDGEPCTLKICLNDPHAPESLVRVCSR